MTPILGSWLSGRKPKNDDFDQKQRIRNVRYTQILSALRSFLDLLPPTPLQVGTVTAIAGGVATVELPGGGTLQARGEAAVGTRVFVRDGAIEGPAPVLPVVLIDV